MQQRGFHDCYIRFVSGIRAAAKGAAAGPSLNQELVSVIKTVVVEAVADAMKGVVETLGMFGKGVITIHNKHAGLGVGATKWQRHLCC